MRYSKYLQLSVLLFFVALATSSLSAQDIAAYSDTWLDDESGFSADPEQHQYFVVGGGVVEILSDYYHTVDVEYTVQSPENRSITEHLGCSGNCKGTSLEFVTALELRIDPDPPDVGEYNGLMNIEPTCSGGGGPIEVPTNYPVGITFIAMQLALPPNHNGYGWLYEKVQPCDVYCNAPQTNRYPGAQAAACIQLQIPYGPFGCSFLVRVKRGVLACVCFDVSWN